ncbi:MAG: hypothetical protein HY835_00695 [Anaerolineae bacterium]|nr:hypothetical protein [Anaerolineae bacterium]
MKVRSLVWMALAALLVVGCVPGQPEEQPTQTPFVVTVVVEPTTAPSDTPAPSPTVADSPTPGPSATPQPSPTTGPQCVVQQGLNFRSGPGTAFNPPLGTLQKDAVVIPQGFNPSGFPGGTWVQVSDPSSGKVGWVSAGAEFVKCNVDVNSLPRVDVAAPPRPKPPALSNSQPDGTPLNLDGSVITSPDFLIRMAVKEIGTTKDGDGVKRVFFTVLDENGNEVYSRTENNAGYCIFGGGEPDCNPWPLYNYAIAWSENGPVVKDGTYAVRILVEPVSANGDESLFANWDFTITLDFP